MTSRGQIADPKGRLSAEGRRRLLSLPAEPLFVGDWDRALFLHFEVDPVALQRETTFELDLFDGRALVSLVAFTMRRMRLWLGGHLTEWLLWPIATHEFLNVRIYVRHNDEPGIQFLAEWLPNRLSALIGPPAFGLPYRLGRLEYQHQYETGTICGRVEATEGVLIYRGVPDPQIGFTPVSADSLDEFLLERYTAFTTCGSRRRFFHVWHEPWSQCPLDVEFQDLSMLTSVWPWFHEARFAGANYSPGATDVWMGRPHRIRD